MVARVKHGNAAAKKNGKGKRNFNPFPDPKRGKGRSVLKRPSAKKTKAWKEVPYTRHSSKLPSKSDLKLDREKKLVKMLLQDGLLSTWAGKLCPRCGKGTLSSLQGGDNLRHRCNRKNCQVYINPQHLHPLFVDARGTSATSLRTQAALLMLKLNNVPHATIHRLLGVNRKSIESMGSRLCSVRKKYLEEKEKKIDFAAGAAWSDVEADETTFDRKNLDNLAPDKAAPIAWEQW